VENVFMPEVFQLGAKFGEPEFVTIFALGIRRDEK